METIEIDKLPVDIILHFHCCVHGILTEMIYFLYCAPFCKIDVFFVEMLLHNVTNVIVHYSFCKDRCSDLHREWFWQNITGGPQWTGLRTKKQS